MPDATVLGARLREGMVIVPTIAMTIHVAIIDGPENIRLRAQLTS